MKPGLVFTAEIERKMTNHRRSPGEYIKLWPKVAITAWQNNAGGPYRAWRVAHHYNVHGSGKVYKSELYDYLAGFDLHPRTRRRWVRGAVELGLFSEAFEVETGQVVYYLAGLARGASYLGCNSIGLPASLEVSDVLEKGWRSAVWLAYNATLNGRPASQEFKQDQTGVSPRTQRNYLEGAPVKKNKNYAKRKDLPAKEDYLAGYEEVTGRSVVVNEQGVVIQRLPQALAVPEEVARREPKGRTRKAQRKLNATSSNVGREKGRTQLRLFHDDPKEIKATERRTADLKVSDIPVHLFLKEATRKTVSFWDTLPLKDAMYPGML